MNKYYGIHDEWTDIDKVNDIEIQSTDGVISGITVNGEETGGGGDFSTAAVTIVGGANGLALSGGVEGTSDGYIFIKADEYGDTGVTAVGVPAQTSTSVKALLFKNLYPEMPHAFYALFNVVDGSIASVAGECELDNEGTSVTIWGDCTITAS